MTTGITWRGEGAADWAAHYGGRVADPLRTIECVQCHETADANGCYADPLGRRPGPEAICGPCIDHLDGREWTKALIEEHLREHVGADAYIHSSNTKADLVAWHSGLHGAADQG